MKWGNMLNDAVMSMPRAESILDRHIQIEVLINNKIAITENMNLFKKTAICVINFDTLCHHF